MKYRAPSKGLGIILMSFKGRLVPPPGEWGPSGRCAGHAYLLVTQISVETGKPAQTQRRGEDVWNFSPPPPRAFSSPPAFPPPPTPSTTTTTFERCVFHKRSWGRPWVNLLSITATQSLAQASWTIFHCLKGLSPSSAHTLDKSQGCYSTCAPHGAGRHA